MVKPANSDLVKTGPATWDSRTDQSWSGLSFGFFAKASVCSRYSVGGPENWESVMGISWPLHNGLPLKPQGKHLFSVQNISANSRSSEVHFTIQNVRFYRSLKSNVWEEYIFTKSGLSGSSTPAAGTACRPAWCPGQVQQDPTQHFFRAC